MFDIFMLGTSMIFLIVGLIEYIRHKGSEWLTGGGIMLGGYVFVKVIDKIFK